MQVLIYDRDAKFGRQVSEMVAALNLKTVRTSFRSPWQNGVAERWVGSCRRDLHHVIPLGERHLKRLLADYVRYFHQDRTHLGLQRIRRITAPWRSRARSLSFCRSLDSAACIIATTQRPDASLSWPLQLFKKNAALYFTCSAIQPLV